MRSFDDMFLKQMQDEEFKKEYEPLQTEMDAIRVEVDMNLLGRYNKNMSGENHISRIKSFGGK